MLEPEDKLASPISDEDVATTIDEMAPDSSDPEQVVSDDPSEPTLNPGDDLASDGAPTWAADPPSSMGGGASW